jgi:hypothetical protein
VPIIIVSASIQRECPECADGVCRAQSVTGVPDRPLVIVTLVCGACQYEWRIAIDSPPLRPGTRSKDE